MYRYIYRYTSVRVRIHQGADPSVADPSVKGSIRIPIHQYTDPSRYRSITIRIYHHTNPSRYWSRQDTDLWNCVRYRFKYLFQATILMKNRSFKTRFTTVSVVRNSRTCIPWCCCNCWSSPTWATGFLTQQNSVMWVHFSPDRTW